MLWATRWNENTADRRYISMLITLFLRSGRVRSSAFLLVISSFALPTVTQGILRTINQPYRTINQLNWTAINCIDLRTVAASSSSPGGHRRHTNVGLVSASSVWAPATAELCLFWNSLSSLVPPLSSVSAFCAAYFKPARFSSDEYSSIHLVLTACFYRLESNQSAAEVQTPLDCWSLTAFVI